MCRNIKTLYNFEPPATEQEIQAAAAPSAAPKNRDAELEKARARSAKRFG